MRTILLTLAMALCLALLPFSAFAQITQVAELTASDGASGDEFGWSVALSGDTAVIGAPFAADPYHDEGAAYVFVNSGGVWSQAAKLAASDGYRSYTFGTSVSISEDGSTIAVGAPGPEFGAGQAYVFVKPATGWADMTETAKLTVRNGLSELGVGTGVAVNRDGSIVAVAVFECGCGFVFAKQPGGWASETESALLVAPAVYYHSVAISGNTLALATSLYPQVSVYILERGSLRINPIATLTGTGSACQYVGLSLAISGDTIVSGGAGSSAAPGSVCVYVKPASGWTNMTQTAALTVSTTQLINLGASVAMSGNTIVAGAPSTLIGVNAPGAFFGYVEPAGGWVNTDMPAFFRTSSDGVTGDEFGYSVAASGHTLVVGAPSHAVNGNVNQGAAYIFGPKP